MIFRNTIYIGETDGNIIYFDTKKKRPVKAKNTLVSNKKTHNSYLLIAFIIVMLLAMKSISFLTKTPIISLNYTPSILIFLFFLWVLEAVFLTKLINNALYKNVHNVVPATKKEMNAAILTNNIWNVFNNKKITFSKKIISLLLIVLIVFCTLSVIPILYLINQNGELIGQSIGSEFIMLSLLGVLPSVSILILWENNPFRWLCVVDRYRNEYSKGGNKF